MILTVTLLESTGVSIISFVIFVLLTSSGIGTGFPFAFFVMATHIVENGVKHLNPNHNQQINWGVSKQALTFFIFYYNLF
jgi:hypothetical protein